jgi:Spy/CpxP family protein refolding chaperone
MSGIDGWKSRATVALVAVLAALTIGAWSAPASAQPRPPGEYRYGSGMMLPMLLRGANLTPDQQARVREIVAAHRPAFRALGDQLRAAEEVMAGKLFATGQVAPEDVTAYVQQVSQLREQLLREAVAATLEVRAVLTPDQLARASQIHDRMKALRSEMRSLWEGQ